MRPYPKDLPLTPIASDLERCITCTYVWLDPLSGEPDSNHCVMMEADEYSLDRFTPEQKRRIGSISGEVECPLYEPKKD